MEKFLILSPLIENTDNIFNFLFNMLIWANRLNGAKMPTMQSVTLTSFKNSMLLSSSGTIYDVVMLRLFCICSKQYWILLESWLFATWILAIHTKCLLDFKDLLSVQCIKFYFCKINRFIIYFHNTRGWMNYC